MKKKCEICHQRDATLVLREIEGGTSTRRMLCEICAAERGLGPSPSPQEKSTAGAGTSLTAQTFMRRLEQGPARRRHRCPDCGSTYAEIRRRGLFGCATCYETFEVEVAELLRRIHGEGRHKGKTPVRPEGFEVTPVGERGAGEPKGESVEELQRRLAAAVKREEFELAAQLRDRIRSLKRPDENP